MAFSSASKDSDDPFSLYMSEVKAIEKADAVLTSSQQIDRLNRPGSKYFNLNPYDVLQVDPEDDLNEVKKKYRKLSILVHPDKNQQDSERAKKAFDAVKKAWETLNKEETRKECLGVVEDAKNRLELQLKAKRKKQKKEGNVSQIPEDNEITYALELHKETCKLFADLAIVRQEMEMREMNERKRQRQFEIEAEEKAKLQKEWNKNYEESREGRISSWQNFKKGSGKKRKAASNPMKSFRPPKVKMEER
uniref:DnaJ homolog subfamily C member 8-like n=1 Tax=Phallusia mammillata TaxID=59560 RepID=A0A6F9DBT3_9ASCI|nr:dnaJ homolog subfamily C member 8-like [Phallusia mammillata]